MTSYAPMTFADLFSFGTVNVDRLTETYGLSFYGEYLTRWPEYQRVARHASGILTGYVLGKAEGDDENWHGHISAVTVASPFRRLGIADCLIKGLEATSADIHNTYFVDLFVRESNAVAVAMYRRMGYVVYRTVLDYYAAGGCFRRAENALDMRKPMPRHALRSKSAVTPLTKQIQPYELEWT